LIWYLIRLVREVLHETHISAEKKAEKHGTWFPEKNEYVKRQEGIAEKTQKRQKNIVRMKFS